MFSDTGTGNFAILYHAVGLWCSWASPFIFFHRLSLIDSWLFWVARWNWSEWSACHLVPRKLHICLSRSSTPRGRASRGQGPRISASIELDGIGQQFIPREKCRRSCWRSRSDSRQWSLNTLNFHIREDVHFCRLSERQQLAVINVVIGVAWHCWMPITSGIVRIWIRFHAWLWRSGGGHGLMVPATRASTGAICVSTFRHLLSVRHPTHKRLARHALIGEASNTVYLEIVCCGVLNNVMTEKRKLRGIQRQNVEGKSTTPIVEGKTQLQFGNRPCSLPSNLANEQNFIFGSIV